jgi:hypothetical protein
MGEGMRNTKTCPKCGSSDVVAVPRQVGRHGRGGEVGVGVKFWGVVDVTRYVCCGCGFSEEWFEDPQDLEKIKKKFGADRR